MAFTGPWKEFGERAETGYFTLIDMKCTWENSSRGLAEEAGRPSCSLYHGSWIFNADDGSTSFKIDQEQALPPGSLDPNTAKAVPAGFVVTIGSDGSLVKVEGIDEMATKMIADGRARIGAPKSEVSCVVENLAVTLIQSLTASGCTPSESSTPPQQPRLTHPGQDGRYSATISISAPSSLDQSTVNTEIAASLDSAILRRASIQTVRRSREVSVTCGSVSLGNGVRGVVPMSGEMSSSVNVDLLLDVSPKASAAEFPGLSTDDVISFQRPVFHQTCEFRRVVLVPRSKDSTSGGGGAGVTAVALEAAGAAFSISLKKRFTAKQESAVETIGHNQTACDALNSEYADLLKGTMQKKGGMGMYQTRFFVLSGTGGVGGKGPRLEWFKSAAAHANGEPMKGGVDLKALAAIQGGGTAAKPELTLVPMPSSTSSSPVSGDHHDKAGKTYHLRPLDGDDSQAVSWFLSISKHLCLSFFGTMMGFEPDVVFMALRRASISLLRRKMTM